jgi:hypothetical protein
LNTQSYPTYAGEVVQILSAYIDTFSIAGTVRTYLDLELIYKWFIAYMTIATQGNQDAGVYNYSQKYVENPVAFSYPHRGWNLNLRPNSLPQFMYGTEIVAPQWQMQGAVVEADELFLTNGLPDSKTQLNSLAQQAAIQGLENLNASFASSTIYNPFNSINADNSAAAQQFLNGATYYDPNTQQLADYFQNLVSQYAAGNLNGLLSPAAISQPPSTQGTFAANQTLIAGTGTTNPLGQILTTAPATAPVAIVAGNQASLGPNGVASAPSNAPGAVQQVIAAANQIISYPYIFGGGYSGFSLPPSNGGFDCASAVSWALHGGGFLSTPMDSTSLVEFWQANPSAWQLGEGEWITAYSIPSYGAQDPTFEGHAWLVVANLLFDTSYLLPGYTPQPSSPSTGPRWLPDSAIQYQITADQSNGIFTYHPVGM